MTNQSELEQFIRKHTFADFAPGGDGSDVVMVDPEVLADYITANYIPRQSYIELLNLFGTPACESLHHPKKYQHRAVEDCPVVERIAKLTKGENQ